MSRWWLGTSVIRRPATTISPPSGSTESGNDVEQRRLSAAGRAQQGKTLALADIERHFIDGPMAAVTLAYAIDHKEGHMTILYDVFESN